jgi:hypothetical protein
VFADAPLGAKSRQKFDLENVSHAVSMPAGIPHLRAKNIYRDPLPSTFRPDGRSIDKH